MFTKIKEGIRICFIFGIILLQFSCTKTGTNQNNGLNNPNSVPAHEKRLKITEFGSSELSFSYSMITYDSMGRIKTFTGVPGDYKVYYQNDTIHHILEPRSSVNGTFIRSSWIFVYGEGKRLAKVFIKHLETGNPNDFTDDNPFWSSTNDGYAALLDSLVYSPSGQLTGIWGPGAFYIQFLFDNMNAQSPSGINEIRDSDGDGVPDELWSTTLLTYTDVDQPGSQQLWFFPFISFSVAGSPTVPATDSRIFLVLLKKCIRQYISSNGRGYYEISQNFKYGYNADSTLFTGGYDPPYNFSPNFYYLFAKQ